MKEIQGEMGLFVSSTEELQLVIAEKAGWQELEKAGYTVSTDRNGFPCSTGLLNLRF